MPQLIQPQTQRLQLRQWRAEDRAPFAALNADPNVMAYFPQTLDRAQSDALADGCEANIAERGWGLWAVELRATGAFIGFVGLNRPAASLPFSPCVEVGWRLAKAYWGQGLATEAAQTALRVGFKQLALSEIVSFTAIANQRSIAVMEKLSMQRDAQPFEHPGLPADNDLRLHYLYRASAKRWHSQD